MNPIAKICCVILCTILTVISSFRVIDGLRPPPTIQPRNVPTNYSRIDLDGRITWLVGPEVWTMKSENGSIQVPFNLIVDNNRYEDIPMPSPPAGINWTVFLENSAGETVFTRGGQSQFETQDILLPGERALSTFIIKPPASTLEPGLYRVRLQLDDHSPSPLLSVDVILDSATKPFGTDGISHLRRFAKVSSADQDISQGKLKKWVNQVLVPAMKMRWFMTVCFTVAFTLSLFAVFLRIEEAVKKKRNVMNSVCEMAVVVCGSFCVVFTLFHLIELARYAYDYVRNRELIDQLRYREGMFDGISLLFAVVAIAVSVFLINCFENEKKKETS